MIKDSEFNITGKYIIELMLQVSFIISHIFCTPSSVNFAVRFYIHTYE